ncbi:MAG: hypothetical protein O6952_10065 [Planctomycetota bacterium]|nr:hypothetical protein [Planctomycetota bacterium]
MIPKTRIDQILLLAIGHLMWAVIPVSADDVVFETRNIDVPAWGDAGPPPRLLRIPFYLPEFNLPPPPPRFDPALPVAQEAPPLPGSVSGKWVNRFAFRRVDYTRGGQTDRGERSDQDVWSYLSVKARDLQVEGLTASFSGRYTQDLDGHRGGSVFTDTLNSNASNEIFRIYRLSATHATEKITVRAGRQSIHVVDWARFDGGRIDIRPVRWVQATGFVGRRVFFHHEASEKVVTGAELGFYLGRTRIKLRDLYHIRNAFEVELSQDIFDTLTATAAFGLINDHGNEVRADLDWYLPPTGTRVRLGYSQNLGRPENEFVLGYTVVGNSEKDDVRWLKIGGRERYQDYRADVRQEISSHVGSSFRYMIRDSRSGTQGDDLYTVDFHLAAVSLDLRNLAFDGLLLSGTYRYWAALNRPKAGETISHEFLGEAAYRIGPASVGGGVIFRTFDARTPFVRVENRDSTGFRVFLAWDLGRSVNARLEYMQDRDYDDVFPDIDFIQGWLLRIEVRY